MFFTRENNDTSNQKPQRCERFAPKSRLLSFCRRLQLAAHSQFAGCFANIPREKTAKKSYSSSFSREKVKLGNWSKKVSHISLSMKKIVEWRQNNSRSKKKGTRSKLILICTFSGAILSSQWPFYSNSVISNCLQKLTWFLIPGLPYILSLSHYIKFYKRFYWFVFFVISRCLGAGVSIFIAFWKELK